MIPSVTYASVTYARDPLPDPSILPALDSIPSPMRGTDEVRVARVGWMEAAIVLPSARPAAAGQPSPIGLRSGAGSGTFRLKAE